MIRACRRMRGMTLIEVILFIVIVSVGLAGVLSTFIIATARSADPMVRKQALTVAEQMLEEILLKDYDDPSGACAAATTPRCAANTPLDRQNYNDVGDYGGWNQTGVTDLTGTTIAGLENYTVTVAVDDGSGDFTPSATARKIAVTVAGGGETVTLIGYRTQYE